MSNNNDLSRAWKCFMIIKKEELKQTYNEENNNQIMKKMGDTWKSLSSEEKLSYLNASIPENHGKKWTKQEDITLFNDIQIDNDLEKICEKYKRTKISILLRLSSIAIKIHKNDNISLEQISSMVNISVENLEKYIEEEKKKEKSILDKYSHQSNSISKGIRLNTKQKIAFDLMKNGENVFITGPGGVGKTHCINLFINHYRNKKELGITSTTGTSAILFGGTTLHSFLGIGLGKLDVNYLFNIIMSKKYLSRRWLSLKTLIIDEISMLSPVLFDKLELLARMIKQTDIPFGGIQLILSGDFLQLPVVDTDKFCFEADTWNICVNNIVCLDEIIRQTNISFQNCLNDIRFGNVSEETQEILNSRINIELVNNDGIKPTRLFPLNRNVDSINKEEISKITTQFYQYDMTIENIGSIPDFLVEKLIKNCQATETTELAVGAQVMLLWNMDFEKELINGSRGIIVGFNTDDIPVVKFLNGIEIVIDFHTWEINENNKIVLNISQIPLRLAYSFTIHKLQGSSLDYVELDLSNIFEYGQAYVALSRVKNLEGLKILSIDYSKIRAHPTAVHFYHNLSM